MSKMARLKKIGKHLCIAGIATVGIIGGINAFVLTKVKDKTYSAVDSVPRNKVGLVLGCSSKTRSGKRNLFFENRMNAAAELFKADKVEYLLVSGDNHTENYDESTAMKAALVARGVPADRIVCDYAGFRTLDSVVRAKEVFQETSLTVISQEFHNQRAVFIAQYKGIDAVGYNAKDVAPSYSYKMHLREPLARVKTVLDLFVIDQQPRFLGEPIAIGAIW